MRKRVSRRIRLIAVTLGLLLVVAIAGCRAGHSGVRTRRSASRHSRQDAVRRVVCLYDHRPWLNLDTSGDRDPEGLQFRVFLDTGKGHGVLRDGFFRIEMYRIARNAQDRIERTLVSDWDYPTSAVQQVRSRVLGMGYHLRLRWATKDIAGAEVEVITKFRHPDGTTIRSGTKCLRVPVYTS